MKTSSREDCTRTPLVVGRDRVEVAEPKKNSRSRIPAQTTCEAVARWLINRVDEGETTDLISSAAARFFPSKSDGGRMVLRILLVYADACERESATLMSWARGAARDAQLSRSEAFTQRMVEAA